jgi:hypothetical protein
VDRGVVAAATSMPRLGGETAFRWHRPAERPIHLAFHEITLLHFPPRALPAAFERSGRALADSETESVRRTAVEANIGVAEAFNITIAKVIAHPQVVACFKVTPHP